MGFRIEDCLRQLTTSTGPGDLSLAAAVPGHLALSDVIADTDTLVYEAHAVDGSGARSGDWEVGIGQIVLDVATWKLRRLSVLSSSADGSFVDFAAGDKHVALTVSAAQARSLRLSDPVHLYVRADGTGTTGLANTAGEAFGSLIDAMVAAMAMSKAPMIHVGAGTFFGMDVAATEGAFNLSIIGAGIGSTIISGQIEAHDQAKVHISGVTIDSVIANGHGSYLEIYESAFSGAEFGHVRASLGGRVDIADITINGGCSSGAHILADTFGSVGCWGSMTFGADVTFANGFAASLNGLGHIDVSQATYVMGGHSVTGLRYDVRGNGVIFSDGQAATFLPGSIAGSAIGGGQYL